MDFHERPFLVVYEEFLFFSVNHPLDSIMTRLHKHGSRYVSIELISFRYSHLVGYCSDLSLYGSIVGSS